MSPAWSWIRGRSSSQLCRARPRFWREWLRITEALFAICEGPDCALKEALCQPTTYPGAAQRKVFIQERIASLMLTVQPGWRSVACNPFDMAWSTLPFREHPHEAFVSDALKGAYRDRAFPQYLAAFDTVRRRLTAPRPCQTPAGSGLEPGAVVRLVHPSWEADVTIDAGGTRLRHSLHGSEARCFRHDDLLLVAWDGYDPEVFRRDGDLFRAVSADRPSKLLDGTRGERSASATGTSTSTPSRSACRAAWEPRMSGPERRTSRCSRPSSAATTTRSAP